MSQAFICSVSSDFPENYEIGIRAGVWGVEEKYQKKMTAVKKGDLIVFVVASAFRSIHRVLENSYEDRSPLWPAKKGDVYPYRVRIGPAETAGKVSVAGLAPRISFMRGKRWGGTLQGPNGVLNPHLTQADLYLVQNSLAETASDQAVAGPKADDHLILDLPPITWVPGLLEQLARLSNLERLTAFSDPWKNAEEWTSGLFAGVYTDRARIPTVAVMPVERSPGETVLSTLYGLSSVKQMAADQKVKDVQGLIFVRENEDRYADLLRGIPNISAVSFDIRVSLRSH